MIFTIRITRRFCGYAEKIIKLEHNLAARGELYLEATTEADELPKSGQRIFFGGSPDTRIISEARVDDTFWVPSGTEKASLIPVVLMHDVDTSTVTPTRHIDDERSALIELANKQADPGEIQFRLVEKF